MYYNERVTHEKLKKIVRLAAPISYRRYCYRSAIEKQHIKNKLEDTLTAQLRALGLRFGADIYTLIYCNYPLDSHEAARQVDMIEGFINTMI